MRVSKQVTIREEQQNQDSFEKFKANSKILYIYLRKFHHHFSILIALEWV